MSNTVLLGMDDATADIFKQQLANYSQSLEILDKNVPIFHNAQRALEMLKPMPDILLISTNHIRFDSSDYQEELLSGIADLKMNNTTSSVRIAVQADLPPSDPFLRKLALVQVTDIFSGTDSNPSALSMVKVAKQLSVPPNLKNVYQFVSGNEPVEQLSAINDMTEAMATSSVGENDSRVKQLEKLVKVLKEQRDDLSVKSGEQYVPREDYDEILKQLKTIMASGLTDDKFKNLFQKLLDIEDKQKRKISKLNQINEKLNNSLVDMNSRIENSSNESRTIAENKRLKNEIKRLRQKPAMQPQNRVIHKSVQVTNRGAPKSQSTAYSPTLNKVLRILMILVALMAVIFGGIYGIHKIQNNQQTAQEPSKPKYSSLIKSGNYDEAAKYYPKKAVDAENAMMADKDLSAKGTMAERISKYSDSDVIKFDVDYFKDDYQGAVDIYKNSPDPELTQLTDARRIMVAYSLMKIGSIAEAKKVAGTLNNENLNKRIEIYSKFYNANKILSNKITNGHLSKSQIKKAKQQIKENQEAMDKL